MRTALVACVLALVVTVAQAAEVKTIVVSSDGLTNAEMGHMGGGYLYLTADGTDANNARVIVLGTSSQRGEKWQLVQRPWLPGLALGGKKTHAFGYAGLIWCYGGLYVAGQNLNQMPIFYTDAALGPARWDPCMLSSPKADTTRRVVKGMQTAHKETRWMWAGGYEVTANGMRGALWRSTDSSMSWQEVAVPGGAATQVSIGGRAPDFTVWGWTADEWLLRLDPDGTVKTLKPPALRGLGIIYSICAPTNKDVFVLGRDGQFGEHVVGWSADRGRTWNTRWLTASGAPMMDCAWNADFGAIATESDQPTVRDGWWLHLFKSGMADKQYSEFVSGFRGLGLAAVQPGEAYLLGVKSSPSILYLVRVDINASINNDPPTAPTVTITPANPKSSDSLRCEATGSTDPDGDPVTYKYQWYEHGVLQTGRIYRVLAARWTRPGRVWKCVVTPTDGKLDGPTAEAYALINP